MLFAQFLSKVRADKSRSTGNDDFHLYKVYNCDNKGIADYCVIPPNRREGDRFHPETPGSATETRIYRSMASIWAAAFSASAFRPFNAAISVTASSRWTDSLRYERMSAGKISIPYSPARVWLICR